MIGIILKNMRLSAKLSQSELGKKLNMADTTISSYERENSQPDFSTIVNIAKISELTNDFGFEDIDNTNNTSQTELLITVKTGIEKIAYGFIIGMLVITLGTVIVIKRKSQRVI